MLQLYTEAPDFSLYATPDQKIRLSQLRGKKVILVFYPADWSPVCSDELSIFNETLRFFRKYNAEVIGISVDGKWSHLAFSNERKLHFSRRSDFEPKGAVSMAYGVYNEETGESMRAIYIIDESGIIIWQYLSPVGINPGVDGVLNALEEITAS